VSLSTVITAGYGTFGSTSFIILDGYDLGGAAPPAAAVVPERPAGGWPERGRRKKLHLPTYPTDAELRKQREEWGILPKAEAIISAVAQRQAEAAKYDEQRYFEELTRELELQNIEFEGKYLESLNVQREKLIDAEIGRLLKEKFDNEDMEIILMLVAASI
jgi:hypothetical protein